MVYIKGEEMTRYTMDLCLREWVHPHVDTALWQVRLEVCGGQPAEPVPLPFLPAAECDAECKGVIVGLGGSDLLAGRKTVRM